jgi:hypothetical protein
VLRNRLLPPLRVLRGINGQHSVPGASLERSAPQPGLPPRLSCTSLVGLPGFEPGTSASRKRKGRIPANYNGVLRLVSPFCIPLRTTPNVGVRAMDARWMASPGNLRQASAGRLGDRRQAEIVSERTAGGHFGALVVGERRCGQDAPYPAGVEVEDRGPTGPLGSLSSSPVMTKPEITKKTSTPMKPPGRLRTPAW